MYQSKSYRQRQQQWRKNEKKRILNEQLSVLPIFEPLKPYEIIFINYMSAYFVILRLIERARSTTFFSIDTETDDISKTPALIQIEFISPHNEEETTTVVIFEMCQLPDEQSVIYPRIQQLVDIICHPTKRLLSWGDMYRELKQFTPYNLFTSSTVDRLNIINIQDMFKDWYNEAFKHNSNCPMALLTNNNDDDPNYTCNHRSYKHVNDTWSLQQAISHIFNEFLDKSVTRSDWGQGLDIRLYQNIQFYTLNYNIKSILTDQQEQNRLQLIEYAANDCSAITRLTISIGNIIYASK